MRESKTKGYECDDSLTPALSRRERGRLGLFQQPARHLRQQTLRPSRVVFDRPARKVVLKSRNAAATGRWRPAAGLRNGARHAQCAL